VVEAKREGEVLRVTSSLSDVFGDQSRLVGGIRSAAPSLSRCEPSALAGRILGGGDDAALPVRGIGGALQGASDIERGDRSRRRVLVFAPLRRHPSRSKREDRCDRTSR
jgi:hypothetical protein